MDNTKKYAAEAIGTFWLTFAGCGSAVRRPAFPRSESAWSVSPWRSA